jgi:hypothetical protein
VIKMTVKLNPRNVLLASILVVFFLISPAYASGNSTEIFVKSPYQVVPGTSVPLYVTVKHFGGTRAIQTISDVRTLSTQVKSLESASQSDTVTINTVEIFSPQPPNTTITASSLAQMQPDKAQTVNKNLVSIAGAIQTKEQLEELYLKKLQEIEQTNLTEEEKTQKLNALFSEYQVYRDSLDSIIQNGKYHGVFLLEIPSDFEEGDILIPVRITYTKKGWNARDRC